MFISVGNFINLGCHVKGNCRLVVEPYCFLIPCQLEITFRDYSLTQPFDKGIL